MIPVVWDGSQWVKADITQKWYDYDKKEWANVVLVTEETRTSYIKAEPGTTINEPDVLAHLVWIPRYKYKLFNVEYSEIPVQEIKIIFEENFQIKSSGSQNVYNLFTTAQKFNDYALYGVTSDFDAHMMKNMEWGAVVYLTQSKFGKNAEVWINNSKYQTGCAGDGPTAEYASTCLYSYTTSNGQQASTTGNIYRIYDMNGGSYEYVMAVMYSNNNQTLLVGLSEFDQETLDSPEMAKYIDKYKYGTNSNDRTKIKLGDATGETRKWYEDSNVYPSSEKPWFVRGGGCDNSYRAGIFYSTYDDGAKHGDNSFRVVISKK